MLAFSKPRRFDREVAEERTNFVNFGGEPPYLDEYYQNPSDAGTNWKPQS